MPEPIGPNASDTVFYAISKWICVRVYINPHAVTLATIPVTHAVSWMLLTHWPWLAIISLVFLRVFLDIVDGTMARQYKKTSTLGRNLDILCDAWYFVVVFCTFVYLYGSNMTLARAVMALTMGGLFTQKVVEDFGGKGSD